MLILSPSDDGAVAFQSQTMAQNTTRRNSGHAGEVARHGGCAYYRVAPTYYGAIAFEREGMAFPSGDRGNAIEGINACGGLKMFGEITAECKNGTIVSKAKRDGLRRHKINKSLLVLDE